MIVNKSYFLHYKSALVLKIVLKKIHYGNLLLDISET